MLRLKQNENTEGLVCIALASVAMLAFAFSHTFYVITRTYICGVVLFAATGLLFWLRFRKRRKEINKSVKLTYSMAWRTGISAASTACQTTAHPTLTC
jgi:FtsH-binding integral membrane protein